MALNSMDANGTDCVSQNTLAGASRSKSHLVKEVVLCLFFPFTGSDTQVFRDLRVKCCCYCIEVNGCFVSRAHPQNTHLILCVCVHLRACGCIDFPFHLFSHLYFASIPVFFYLFVDIFSEFTLMENAILSHPLTFLLFPFFFPPLTNRNSVSMFVWDER